MLALKARRLAALAALAIGAGIVFVHPAWAADPKPLDGPATAWILTSCALVLFMTLPGLAMFYGGLVRQQNALSVLMHCVFTACIVSVIWLAFGYSLAFGDGGGANAWLGGLDKAFLAGITAETQKDALPETVYFMFQLTFAIITPALIVGAYPERIKFSAMAWFTALWLVLVYIPVCHWIWGGGWLADKGVIDFAGGLVVHVTAGTAALVAAIMIGPRKGFPQDQMAPHSPGMTAAGAGMLWVGWYGFNAGSALAANGSAGMAMLVTHMSASMGALTWMTIEWVRYGKPSLVGIVTGLVAGLATVTPAAGSIGPIGGLALGIAGGLVCFSVTAWIKRGLKIDDSLDVFAVHGVGGALGILLTAVFGLPGLGGAGFPSGASMAEQLATQATGLVVTFLWSGVVTAAILGVLKVMLGLRVNQEAEFDGLDVTEHGERAYDIR